MPSALSLPKPSRPERRAPLHLRLRVAASHPSLDHAIATGHPIDSDELRLRARQLVSRHGREQVATGIDHAIERAEQEPARLRRARVLIQRRAVKHARGRLLELARELAQASELITDGASPVFSKHPDGALSQRAASILLTLAPR